MYRHRLTIGSHCQSVSVLVAIMLMTLAIGWGLVSPVHAQRRQQPTVVEMTLYSGLKGQVVGIRPGMIQWTDDAGEPMYVKLTPQTQIQVMGTADPDFLRPGLFVRFSASLNDRGEVGGEVAELTIFTPRDGYSVGIFSDSDDPTATDGQSFVAGQLKTLRNSKFVVAVGNQQVRGELATEPKVKLALADYSLAQPGDQITVTGVGFERDKIEARGIEIHLAEPLSTGKKKPRRSVPGTSRKETPSAADDSR